MVSQSEQPAPDMWNITAADAEHVISMPSCVLTMIITIFAYSHNLLALLVPPKPGSNLYSIVTYTVAKQGVDFEANIAVADAGVEIMVPYKQVFKRILAPVYTTDANGNLVHEQEVDDNGDPAVDANGDPILAYTELLRSVDYVAYNKAGVQYIMILNDDHAGAGMEVLVEFYGSYDPCGTPDLINTSVETTYVEPYWVTLGTIDCDTSMEVILDATGVNMRDEALVVMSRIIKKRMDDIVMAQLSAASDRNTAMLAEAGVGIPVWNGASPDVFGTQVTDQSWPALFSLLASAKRIGDAFFASHVVVPQAFHDIMSAWLHHNSNASGMYTMTPGAAGTNGGRVATLSGMKVVTAGEARIIEVNGASVYVGQLTILGNGALYGAIETAGIDDAGRIHEMVTYTFEDGTQKQMQMPTRKKLRSTRARLVVKANPHMVRTVMFAIPLIPSAGPPAATLPML